MKVKKDREEVNSMNRSQQKDCLALILSGVFSGFLFLGHTVVCFFGFLMLIFGFVGLVFLPVFYYVLMLKFRKLEEEI